MSKMLIVTLKKSIAGCSKYQKAVVLGLGLRKVNSSVKLPATNDFKGMINKVRYMLDVKEV